MEFTISKIKVVEESITVEADTIEEAQMLAKETEFDFVSEYIDSVTVSNGESEIMIDATMLEEPLDEIAVEWHDKVE